MSCTKLLWMQFTCLEMLWDRYLNIKELTIRKNEQGRKRKLPHWKTLKQASMEFILALKPPRMSIYLSLMTWTRKFFETWTYSPEVPTPKINPGILSFWSPRMSKHLIDSKYELAMSLMIMNMHPLNCYQRQSTMREKTAMVE